MDVKNLNEVPSFITADGSEIRELLAHRNSAIRNQSLAEARIPHRYEEFDDTHSDIDYRMDVSLPFLARALR